ncbi:winged helix-turn-helix transcriptional regulator [Alkanindiges illinoisensis]|uniref:winged helix-turn-helix transcriptional regulator n=1 Tax=Alkanindiges illinoisensis TaxID=197183 RepID=UPI00047CC600|nr:helix-turn-helix domain-containing protein [Alkanindiges illinoisensis]
MPNIAHQRLDCTVGCPVEGVLEIIGGKWKGVILYHLLDETLRFNEIRRRLPGITQRMLTNQLRELEASGIVFRQVYAEVPPKVEYYLTSKGKTLAPIIRAMELWGRENLLPQAEAVTGG